MEKVKSEYSEKFFPGHALRVIGHRGSSSRFDIAAHATQWIDLIEFNQKQAEICYYVTYAALGIGPIPLGRHEFILKAEGGGLPSRARVVVNCSSDKSAFKVTEFQLLS